MPQLRSLGLQKNSFSGEVPAEWFNTPNVFPQLRALDIRWNKLRGAIPKHSTSNMMAMRNNFSISLFGYPVKYHRRSRRIPRMCVLPMHPGYGLCGESPRPGPLLTSVSHMTDCAGREYKELPGWGPHEHILYALPPCPSGKPPISPYCIID